MAVSTDSINEPGKVFLVGAGPGDPRLLTFRARECLESCDAILYDYLANPAILEMGNPNAEMVCLGKHGLGKIWSQNQINQKLVELASAGKSVVRLKGGDPLIFGRAGEEISALVKADIPYEIVPGITAAIATAAYCGLPLTHRDLSSSLVLVTASRKNGDHRNGDFGYLAKFPGTLAVYMGTTTVEFWANELLNHGKSPETPVLIVRHATTNRQSTQQCNLGTVIEKVLGPPKLRPPAMFLVGEMAAQENRHDWFSERPLFGQTVLVTRAQHQSQNSIAKLENLGANAIPCPMIAILPAKSDAKSTKVFSELSSYRWVVFTSTNGVSHFFNALEKNGLDVRAFGSAKIAAIGDNTCNELRRHFVKPDIVPTRFDSESLAKELIDHSRTQDKILLIQGNRSREVLPKILSDSARPVETLEVYQSLDIETPNDGIIHSLIEGEIDWVTLTSPAIARNFVRLYGQWIERTKLVTISPITTQALKECGFTPALEAIKHTFNGVVDAMLKTTAKMKTD